MNGWHGPLQRLAIACRHVLYQSPGTAPLKAGAALGGAHARLAACRVRDGAQVPAAVAQWGHAHSGRLDRVHAPLGQRDDVAAPLVHLCKQGSGLPGVRSGSAVTWGQR